MNDKLSRKHSVFLSKSKSLFCSLKFPIKIFFYQNSFLIGAGESIAHEEDKTLLGSTISKNGWAGENREDQILSEGSMTRDVSAIKYAQDLSEDQEDIDWGNLFDDEETEQPYQETEKKQLDTPPAKYIDLDNHNPEPEDELDDRELESEIQNENPQTQEKEKKVLIKQENEIQSQNENIELKQEEETQEQPAQGDRATDFTLPAVALTAAAGVVVVTITGSGEDSEEVAKQQKEKNEKEKEIAIRREQEKEEKKRKKEEKQKEKEIVKNDTKKILEQSIQKDIEKRKKEAEENAKNNQVSLTKDITRNLEEQKTRNQEGSSQYQGSKKETNNQRNPKKYDDQDFNLDQEKKRMQEKFLADNNIGSSFSNTRNFDSAPIQKPNVGSNNFQSQTGYNFGPSISQSKDSLEKDKIATMGSNNSQSQTGYNFGQSISQPNNSSVKQKNSNTGLFQQNSSSLFQTNLESQNTSNVGQSVSRPKDASIKEKNSNTGLFQQNSASLFQTNLDSQNTYNFGQPNSQSKDLLVKDKSANMGASQTAEPVQKGTPKFGSIETQANIFSGTNANNSQQQLSKSLTGNISNIGKGNEEKFVQPKTNSSSQIDRSKTQIGGSTSSQSTSTPKSEITKTTGSGLGSQTQTSGSTSSQIQSTSTPKLEITKTIGSGLGLSQTGSGEQQSKTNHQRNISSIGETKLQGIEPKPTLISKTSDVKTEVTNTSSDKYNTAKQNLESNIINKQGESIIRQDTNKSEQIQKPEIAQTGNISSSFSSKIGSGFLSSQKAQPNTNQNLELKPTSGVKTKEEQTTSINNQKSLIGSGVLNNNTAEKTKIVNEQPASNILKNSGIQQQTNNIQKPELPKISLPVEKIKEQTAPLPVIKASSPKTPEKMIPNVVEAKKTIPLSDLTKPENFAKHIELYGPNDIDHDDVSESEIPDYGRMNKDDLDKLKGLSESQKSDSDESTMNDHTNSEDLSRR